ncbi:hypothetical protein HD553DRAFT_343244 [Filobasidium floriforme]|uniref:uncharacterized protein n=1 Tax=Filobasidium floriforme TaxID=5210 RepID=UPI001E8D500E|nr:uncharacterized protein HD553DRAFT_343244 [Filobasidium floriforme]KAH8083249.1 hypothetical protein HD553DRAFT_343244 [Filobasidium floriforme]
MDTTLAPEFPLSPLEHAPAVSQEPPNTPNTPTREDPQQPRITKFFSSPRQEKRSRTGPTPTRPDPLRETALPDSNILQQIQQAAGKPQPDMKPLAADQLADNTTSPGKDVPVPDDDLPPRLTPQTSPPIPAEHDRVRLPYPSSDSDAARNALLRKIAEAKRQLPPDFPPAQEIQWELPSIPAAIASTANEPHAFGTLLPALNSSEIHGRAYVPQGTLFGAAVPSLSEWNSLDPFDYQFHAIPWNVGNFH